MKEESKVEYLAVLANAQADLVRLAASSEDDIQAVARAFKRLAGQADTILKPAAAIVGFAENENMHSVLSTVRSLCLTARGLLEPRLDAATTILEMLKDEEQLLNQLTLITKRQPAIAFHLKALSMHTNIEVAHLGSIQSDFQLLAQELSEFSTSASQQTLELAIHTGTRKQNLQKTKDDLAANLSGLRGEMSHMEADTVKTVQTIDEGLNQLTTIPEQFRNCAEETALQIAGVVAAIQAHDITRQQIEHVQMGLRLVAARVEGAKNGNADGLPLACAGLNIQLYQLKAIRVTVGNWTAQIRQCMAGIQQLSASEIAGIGSAVLNQEKELSAQLAQIELLQEKSHGYGERIQQTLGGLSSLLELVNDYLQRSQAIRERLQLLTFNSLIEANRLGKRGAVVAAIAKLIERVSTEWDLITEHSRLALDSIMALVGQTSDVMKVFSEANARPLREGQAQTAEALRTVRTAAEFVAKEAEQMQLVTRRMQNDLSVVSNTGEHLTVCLGYLEAALNQVESLASQWKAQDPQLAQRWDEAEAERLFSPFYTTEFERTVMHAALRGSALPVVSQTFTGNTVELF